MRRARSRATRAARRLRRSASRLDGGDVHCARHARGCDAAGDERGLRYQRRGTDRRRRELGGRRHARVSHGCRGRSRLDRARSGRTIHSRRPSARRAMSRAIRRMRRMRRTRSYFTDAAGMKDLGVLSGGHESRAFGLNDTGYVVGMAENSDGRESRVFVWLGTRRVARSQRTHRADLRLEPRRGAGHQHRRRHRRLRHDRRRDARLSPRALRRRRHAGADRRGDSDDRPAPARLRRR